MRIVSICPSNTEILAYLDAIDLLVGVDDDSDWPQSITKLPRVGRDLNIDIDKVKALQPDLVLASLSVPGMEKNIERLEEEQMPYIILDPNSLDEIADDLLTVGKKIGKEQKAQQVYDDYYQVINEYRTIANSIPNKKNIYWEWWPKPIFTPGQKNWLSYISELAGASNVFSDYEEASIQVEWDEVIQRDPDEICMVWVGVQEKKMNPDILKKREGANQLRAVQSDQIHILEEYLYCRPSPRLLEGLKKLAYLLHPTYYPAS
ncbi:cobalamin-binding protein [Alkalibacillus haloalkaliphilus]|uniref:cobalamin-binding protein n=1 Tax=Alkalibacillus haloalkaliphilus TaxID=94136 RepID=UPI002935763B|nr:cobalamin-binding protein [Alkalibacillus haloalkaliphilus]MDV2582492.1 cobalamin-binding protein [Alkalibacillus haloalkaliphilus]